jgi:hypothetical protein
MKHWAVLVLVVTLAAGGCASVPARPATAAADLAALSKYYEKASRPQRRAVRKVVRDQRARALRELSRQAELVRSQKLLLEEGLEPVQLAEAEQAELVGAVSEFRQNLSSLQQAAADSNLPVVRREYQRTMRSWQQVRRLADRRRD